MDDFLREAIEMGEARHDFDQLSELYNQITGGDCGGCGKCCAESVHTHFVEFINIYRFMVAENLITDELKGRVREFYTTEFKENQSCPMLVDHRCIIYPVRPLVCRLFGHHSRSEHEANYEHVLEQNKGIAAELFEMYAIEVPEVVIKKKIAYCTDYHNESKTDMAGRQLLVEGILNLNNYYFAEDFIDEDSMDFGLVNWLVEFWFDVEALEDERLSQ